MTPSLPSGETDDVPQVGTEHRSGFVAEVGAGTVVVCGRKFVSFRQACMRGATPFE